MEDRLAHPLFQGERVYLAAVEPEADAATLAGWTHDSGFMRLVDAAPLRPLTAGQVKKRHHDRDAMAGRFDLLIRARSDDRVLGLVRLDRIQWHHGTAHLSLGIADPAERRQGFGREALGLSVDYAFGELNLHRLAAVVPGDNAGGLAFLQRVGFQVEVIRREAVRRDGRRYDLLHLGLLAGEWAAREGGR